MSRPGLDTCLPPRKTYHSSLCRTLARDARSDFEKEHALRLVRVIVEHAGSRLHEASDIIPLSVLRAVIAIAEATEEKLRLSALELLGELGEPVGHVTRSRVRRLRQNHSPAVVRNLPLLVVSGGLRTVLEALSEGLPDFGAHVAPLFLVAVDHPETRQWLRPGVDLEVSPVQDVSGRHTDNTLCRWSSLDSLRCMVVARWSSKRFEQAQASSPCC